MKKHKYIKVIATTQFEQELYFFYCDTRSLLWNSFFGWRQIHYTKGCETPEITFIIPSYIEDLVRKLVRMYDYE